jgi:hypothetical protein
MRRRDQTATDRESSTLGTEIDDGRSLGPGWRKAPPQLRELIRTVFKTTDDRGTLGRPDVVSGFEVRSRVRPLHRNASLTERGEIVTVGNVISEIIAHRIRPRTARRAEWSCCRCTDCSSSPIASLTLHVGFKRSRSEHPAVMLPDANAGLRRRAWPHGPTRT